MFQPAETTNRTHQSNKDQESTQETSLLITDVPSTSTGKNHSKLSTAEPAPSTSRDILSNGFLNFPIPPADIVQIPQALRQNIKNRRKIKTVVLTSPPHKE